MKFIPFNRNINIMKEEWSGYIKIDPPLSNEEANYLNSYISTFHTVQPEEELEGLYCIHNDKQEFNHIPINNYSPHYFPVPKNVQKLVPTLVCPLILGYVNGSKEVNAFGFRPSFRSALNGAKWLDFLIQHFFKKDSFAQYIYRDAFFNFKEHELNGEIIFSLNPQHYPIKDFFNISITKNVTKLFNLGVPMEITRVIGNVQKKSIEYVHSCMKNQIPHLQTLCYNITSRDIDLFLKEQNLHDLLNKKVKFVRLSTHKKETTWQGTEEFYNIYDKYYLMYNVKKANPKQQKNKILKF